MTRLCAAAVLLLASCADEVDSRPATKEYVVRAIFEPSCATANCHSEDSAQGDLVLEGDPGQILGELKTRTLIYPGVAAASPLLHILRGDYTLYRMPPDGPLPDADIDLIRRWIEAEEP